MRAVFLTLFNQSIAASWLVLAILCLRVPLRKAPKALRCVLWALVAIRLVCPFSLESALSLIPSAQTVPPNIVYAQNPTVYSGIPAVNNAVNPYIANALAPTVGNSINPMQLLTSAAAVIWAVGIAAMLLYAFLSYARLRRKTAEAVPFQNGVFLCDRISTPFILGVFRPRIFLPSSIDETDIPYVLAHENAHLKRRDHLWKPLGFALLSVYWFNPVLWVAYILLCKDIELACDEKVVRDLGVVCKKPYAEALIRCSVSQRTLAACPLAFGEGSVKGRIKTVLHYKKPAFWVLAVSIVAAVVLSVCFLTNPKGVPLEDLPQETPDCIAVTANGVGYTITAESSLEYTMEFLQTIRVSRTEISKNRDEGRDKTNSIFLFSEDGSSVHYYFNSDCTQVWAYTGLKPSLTKAVKNPETVQRFFQSHIEATAKTSDLPGLSVEMISYDFTAEVPYFTVRWVNNTDLDLQYGEEFYLYKDVNGVWEDCRTTENYAVDLFARSLPPRSTSEYTYMLYDIECTQNGTYRFESTCTATETGQNLSFDVWYNFSVQGGSMQSVDIYESTPKTYIFADSVDPVSPSIVLSESDSTFQFTYSALSSYIAYGHYVLTDKSLILTTDDGENTYVFDVKKDCFVFNASRSSNIPEYRYSTDAKQTQSPVPNGARFVRAEE